MKKYQKNNNRYEFDSSDDSSDSDEKLYRNVLETESVPDHLNNPNDIFLYDFYQNANKSIPDEEMKPTDARIKFVKNALNGGNLKPMIDFDNNSMETESNIHLIKKVMDVKQLFDSMNIILKYIKSGTTGHTFQAISKLDKNVTFAIKVCAYPKDDYGGITNLARPENAEIRMLKLLSMFVISKQTPHFVLPIGTFNTSITNFVRIPRNTIDLKEKKNELYRKFIDRYNNGDFEDFVSVLISEWCNGGDLLEYIRKNYQSMTARVWKVIFFQILVTLTRVHHRYPSFRHNDMKANNILLQYTNIKDTEKYYAYTIDNIRFCIPNIDIQIKIWDFDFACIDNVIENNKVNSDWTIRMNITKKENKYYDIHYFFNTLISKRFFPQFTEGGVHPDIVDFVYRVIPEKYRNGSNYVNKRGRLQRDIEYTTPYKLIMTDPLFENYRHKIY